MLLVGQQAEHGMGSLVACGNLFQKSGIERPSLKNQSSNSNSSVTDWEKWLKLESVKIWQWQTLKQ